MADTINVTLAAYEGDDFPEADGGYEAYVRAYLAREYPEAAINVSTAQGFTKVFVNGAPDDHLRYYLSNELWSEFCSTFVP